MSLLFPCGCGYSCAPTDLRSPLPHPEVLSANLVSTSKRNLSMLHHIFLDLRRLGPAHAGDRWVHACYSNSIRANVQLHCQHRFSTNRHHEGRRLQRHDWRRPAPRILRTVPPHGGMRSIGRSRFGRGLRGPQDCRICDNRGRDDVKPTSRVPMALHCPVMEKGAAPARPMLPVMMARLLMAATVTAPCVEWLTPIVQPMMADFARP